MGEGESKYVQICVTSFMDDPLALCRLDSRITDFILNAFDKWEENREARESKEQSKISSNGSQKTSPVVDQGFDSFLDGKRIVEQWQSIIFPQVIRSRRILRLNPSVFVAVDLEPI